MAPPLGDVVFRLSISFVDKELSFGPDEEEGILFVLLGNPAAAVVGVDDHVAVFFIDFLLGEEMVFLVVDLEEGVAAVTHNGVHDVAADAVGDNVDLVGVLYVLAHHDDIGHMIVIPVAVAEEPESGPVPGTRGYGVPDDGAAVHHAVVPGVVEVGCRMDGAVARWEHAGTAGTGVAAVAVVGGGAYRGSRSTGGAGSTGSADRTGRCGFGEAFVATHGAYGSTALESAAAGGSGNTTRGHGDAARRGGAGDGGGGVVGVVESVARGGGEGARGAGGAARGAYRTARGAH